MKKKQEKKVNEKKEKGDQKKIYGVHHLGVGVLFLASTVQGTPPSIRLSLPAMAGSTISVEPYSTNAQVRMSSPICFTRRITDTMSPYWENCRNEKKRHRVHGDKTSKQTATTTTRGRNEEKKKEKTKNR